uniref:Uncharacterized protein n=1 Tax=Anguilla anguilla TaxID=7936 RepID=A0A0E9Q5W2_ANGAN
MMQNFTPTLNTLNDSHVSLVCWQKMK